MHNDLLNYRFDKLEAYLESVAREQVSIREEIAKLKVKTSVWSGLTASVITGLALFVFKVMG